MPGISIQIQGMEQLAQRLGKAVSAETLAAPLQRATERLRSRLATYPAELPGQVYQRTGNLGRGWAASVSGSEGTVSNRVSYGPWVQGDKTQARIHRGRWLTDQQAADQEAPAIEADFQQAIDHALNG